ncbi:hypothetical protein VTH06DRAFT_7654 [Thermothelomyces fergusii]
MPVLPPPPSSLDILVGRTVTTNSSDLEPAQVGSAQRRRSGRRGADQYPRYYVLVAACVLARKTEWLRNACLAAALIVPATAAIHAIVLASLHTDDAVDMDIYGALQMCSIGILTAPATVRLSRTYFNNPGRNVLFLWTTLVVAGLLALTVEFFRTEAKDCRDSDGQPISQLDGFPGDTKPNCNLICEEGNPYSPMRTGSADNINLVPKPHYLTFGAATLVAAASCVPGILSMVSIWYKIAKSNWSKQFGIPDIDEVIEGTNGATPRRMKKVSDVIRRLLSVVEISMFAGAVLALIVVGELNFWSPPLFHDTEPIGNIGQWSNIVASVFAAIGSLYMFLANLLDKAENEGSVEERLRHCHCHCHCQCLYHGHGSSRPNSFSDNSENAQPSQPSLPVMGDADPQIGSHGTESAHAFFATRADAVPDNEDGTQGLGIQQVDTNNSTGTSKRGLTNKTLQLMKNIRNFSPVLSDDSDFTQGRATGFPAIPGEHLRSADFWNTQLQWGHVIRLQSGDSIVKPEDNLGPSRGRRSRATSFSGSISRSNSIGPRAHSPKPCPRILTNGPGTSMLGIPTTHSPESTSESGFQARSSAELERTKSRGTVVTLHEGPNSPAIVLSSDDQDDEVQTLRTASSVSELPQASKQAEDPTPEGRLLAVPPGEAPTQKISATEHHVRPRATTRLPPLEGQPASYIEQIETLRESTSSQTSASAQHDTPPPQVAGSRITSSPVIEQRSSSNRAEEERQCQNEPPKVVTDEAILKNTALQVPQSAPARMLQVEEQQPSNHTEVDVARHAEESGVRTGDAIQRDTSPHQSATPIPTASSAVGRPTLNRVESSMSYGGEESTASELAGQHAPQKRTPRPADSYPAEKAPPPASGSHERNQE